MSTTKPSSGSFYLEADGENLHVIKTALSKLDIGYHGQRDTNTDMEEYISQSRREPKKAYLHDQTNPEFCFEELHLSIASSFASKFMAPSDPAYSLARLAILAAIISSDPPTLNDKSKPVEYSVSIAGWPMRYSLDLPESYGTEWNDIYEKCRAYQDPKSKERSVALKAAVRGEPQSTDPVTAVLDRNHDAGGLESDERDSAAEAFKALSVKVKTTDDDDDWELISSPPGGRSGDTSNCGHPIDEQ